MKNGEIDEGNMTDILIDCRGLSLEIAILNEGDDLE